MNTFDYCIANRFKRLSLQTHIKALILASTQSKLLTILLRLIKKKYFLKKQLATGKFDIYDQSEPPTGISGTCNVHKFQIMGRNVFRLEPKTNAGVTTHILYLHGGAYVQGFNRFHWKFLAYLVKATNCTITAPDYPLAPRYTFKESFEMVTALCKLVFAEIKLQDLILMGDSSGGGFALALAQKMSTENIRLRQLILLSPWLDITLTNPLIKDLDPGDPFLEAESLKQAGTLYGKGINADHYLLSPINGSLDGLQKIAVFIGSKDLLVADARRLRDRAQAENVELNYFEFEDMVHAWMFLNLPESKKARQQIVELIRTE